MAQLPAALDNQVSSVINRLPNAIHLALDANWGRSVLCIAAGGNISDLIATPYNDAITSIGVRSTPWCN